jgi:putative hemolysin
MLVSSSAEQGEIEPSDQKMLSKVFDFADKQVADVMVPRPDVVALPVDMPPEDILLAVLSSPYTRYPVYRQSIDDIVGILHVRDLVVAMHDRATALVQIEELLRPAAIVTETEHLVALLTEFKHTNQHMAIVLDESGAMEGIVTLEDILEEIVGEIDHKIDVPRRRPGNTWVRTSGSTVHIVGAVTL